MADEEQEVIATMLYRGVDIKVIEVPPDGGELIRVISHVPFSMGLTCAVSRDLISLTHTSNSLGPFITSLNAAMQLIVNSGLPSSE